MKQFVIGITGGSGVGKTTLIHKLQHVFAGKVATLSLDNYYKPKSDQQRDLNNIVNFDLPTALDAKLLKSDVETLLEGKAIKQKLYHFNHPDKEEEFQIVEPKTILLIEGLFVMHYAFIRSKLDYKVFLDVDENTQLERRLKRDAQERSYDRDEVMYQWENHVIPAYRNYILPYKKEADLIITNHDDFDDNLNQLLTILKKV